MAKIKQFNIFYHQKVSKMLSYISPDEKLSFWSTFINFIPNAIQDFLPLFLRNKKVSFIAINDEKLVKAFISIEAAHGNDKKWFIKKLFLDRNSFDEGKQLIDYIVTKYGAIGADTFCVLVDEFDETTAGLFSKMCGFRLCSREILFRSESYDPLILPENLIEEKCFENFKNSDAAKVAELFKEALFPHFRFSLEKDPNEFTTPFFKHISKEKTVKYVLKDKNENIFGFADIETLFNRTKTIDLILAKPYESDYFRILKSLIYYTKKSSPDYEILILCRNYLSSSKVYETFLKENGFVPTQIKLLFVKDFYKPVQDSEVIANPSLIFKEITGKPAFLKFKPLQKSD